MQVVIVTSHCVVLNINPQVLDFRCCLFGVLKQGVFR